MHPLDKVRFRRVVLDGPLRGLVIEDRIVGKMYAAICGRWTTDSALPCESTLPASSLHEIALSCGDSSQGDTGPRIFSRARSATASESGSESGLGHDIILPSQDQLALNIMCERGVLDLFLASGPDFVELSVIKNALSVLPGDGADSILVALRQAFSSETLTLATSYELDFLKSLYRRLTWDHATAALHAPTTSYTNVNTNTTLTVSYEGIAAVGWAIANLAEDDEDSEDNEDDEDNEDYEDYDEDSGEPCNCEDCRRERERLGVDKKLIYRHRIVARGDAKHIRRFMARCFHQETGQFLIDRVSPSIALQLLSDGLPNSKERALEHARSCGASSIDEFHTILWGTTVAAEDTVVYSSPDGLTLNARGVVESQPKTLLDFAYTTHGLGVRILEHLTSVGPHLKFQVGTVAIGSDDPEGCPVPEGGIGYEGDIQLGHGWNYHRVPFPDEFKKLIYNEDSPSGDMDNEQEAQSLYTDEDPG